MIDNILFLIGSPKANHSTSESLGNYVVDQLEAIGKTVERKSAHKAMRSANLTQKFLDAYDNADLIIVSYPLYVDTLPYLLTKTFEVIADHRRENPAPKTQRIICIGNCGFPEATHVALSLDICRAFADEVGLVWYGGLALGMGGAINGTPIAELSMSPKHLWGGLDEVTNSILADAPVPESAMTAVAKPVIPKRVYLALGTIGWNMSAYQAGVWRKLGRTPYKASLN